MKNLEATFLVLISQACTEQTEPVIPNVTGEFSDRMSTSTLRTEMILMVLF